VRNSEGMLRGSSIPSSQLHLLALLRHVPPIELMGQAAHTLGLPRVHVHLNEPLPFQFHSGRAPLAVSVGPASDGQHVQHATHNVPSLNSSHQDPFSFRHEPVRLSSNHCSRVSLLPMGPDDPPLALPRRPAPTPNGQAAAKSNPTRRNAAHDARQFISHWSLPRAKFDALTNETLGNADETDDLSACSCSSTVH
jgi:hypothetical protein